MPTVRSSLINPLVDLQRLSHGRPARVYNVDRVQSVEYSIASKHNEIMNSFLYRELRNLRFRAHDARLSSELFVLRFDISKGPRDAQPTWEDSIRSEEHLPLIASHLTVLVRDRHILERLRLVNLPTVVLDPVELRLFIRAMVL